MFEGFAKVWTAVVPSSQVTAKKPLAVKVAGEKLVLFRDQAGVVGALLDRCPHRGVALSLGEMKDGCLTCPFHGWEFGRDGAVLHVPLNPDAKREQLFARALPAGDFGGFVYVFTDLLAPGATPPPPPHVPDGLTDPSLARTVLMVDWKAHWTRAMENMLDSPHLPWVHRKTIGKAMRARMTRDSRMDIAWEEKPWGGRATMSLDGSDRDAWLDFFQPNLMALHIPIPGKVLRMHSIMVPIDADTTRMWVVGVRSFAKARVLNPLFNWMNARIAAEDKAVVESSDPKVVPRPALEASVATDRATLRFRKYYFDVLEGSGSTPPPRHGLTVHDGRAA